MSYILDTNVVSEMSKRTRDDRMQDWLDTVAGPNLYLSVMVLGEVRKGVELLSRRDPRQATVYESWLDRLYRQFRTRMLPVTFEVAQEWGRLHSIRPLPIVDGLLAATARAHDWIIVTRNVKDFVGLNVATVNPFDRPSV
jgi:toxin FitB